MPRLAGMFILILWEGLYSATKFRDLGFVPINLTYIQSYILPLKGFYQSLKARKFKGSQHPTKTKLQDGIGEGGDGGFQRGKK